MKYEVKETYFDGAKSWAIFEEFPNYAFSDDGNCINITTKRKMKKQLTYNGYNRVIIVDKQGTPRHVRIGVAVASAFVFGYKEGLQVDHINRNKLDDYYTNLRWVTRKENLDNRSNVIIKKLINQLLADEISPELCIKQADSLGVTDELEEMLNKLNSAQV